MIIEKKDYLKLKIFEKIPYKIKSNDLLTKLVIIRAAELAFINLSKKKKIRGPLHTSVGQEVVAVSVCQNLKKKDSVFSNHRGHGHYIAKDGNITKLVLELMGKKNGCCDGMGGSMHVAEIEKNIIGSNGIVGGGVPIACGYAYQYKLKKINNIAVVFFGDGAMNQGVVLESLNLAAIYKLPVLFVCENNYYAYSTKSSEMSKTALYQRAKGFGIASYKLDGMNLSVSNSEVKKILTFHRTYKSPAFIEFHTYRFHRHFANEVKRKVDYIDESFEKKMIYKDPFYEELKKKNFSLFEIKNLLDNLIEVIVNFGVDYKKK